jgi:hypothetical protein
MYIVPSDPKVVTVTDYDLTFANGLMVPLTVDTEAGDSVEFGDRTVTFQFAPKQSMANPDTMTQAHEITVFLDQVIMVSKRNRQVTQLTPEQWDEIRKAHNQANTQNDAKVYH